MRNVPVGYAGAMAIWSIAMLGGCSKQEPPKPLGDGQDQPITISDTSSAPGPDGTSGKKTGGVAATTSLYMQSSPPPGSTMAPLFSSWNNDNPGNGQIKEIYPPYATFDGIQVTVNGATPPTTTYCNMNPSKCDVKIWYEDQNNPTIFFDYDANGSKKLKLKSTQNNFEKYVNWADATKGNNIIDPTNANLSKLSIDTGGGSTVVQCSSGCTIAILVK